MESKWVQSYLFYGVMSQFSKLLEVGCRMVQVLYMDCPVTTNDWQALLGFVPRRARGAMAGSAPETGSTTESLGFTTLPAARESNPPVFCWGDRDTGMCLRC